MADAGGFPDGRASKEAELGLGMAGFLAASGSPRGSPCGSPRGSPCGSPRGSPWWNVFQVVDAGVKELFPPYILQHVGAA